MNRRREVSSTLGARSAFLELDGPGRGSLQVERRLASSRKVIQIRRPTSQDVNDRVTTGEGVEKGEVGGGDSSAAAREGASSIGVDGDRTTSADGDDEAGDLVKGRCGEEKRKKGGKTRDRRSTKCTLTVSRRALRSSRC